MPNIVIFSHSFRPTFFINIVALVTCFMFLAGCSMGPRQLPGNRLAYNKNIQSSDNEEMLLNLIRSRNDEPPLFLQVGSVTSTFSYELNTDIAMDNGIGSTSTAFVKPKAGLAYSERPTISYTPLQGQDFVTNLLAEIPLRNLAILYRSGWDINVMMWVTVSRLGKVANLGSSVPAGSKEPNTYGEFLKLSRLLLKLQKEEGLVFLAPSYDSNGYTDVIMQAECSEEQAEQLIEFLDEPAEKSVIEDHRLVLQYHLTTTRNLLRKDKNGEHLTPIRLKSFSEILQELSVEGNPEKVLRSKIRQKHGYRPGLVKTIESDTEPSDSFVTIPYGGKWYSILREDYKSKPIFMLLRTIYSLQAGNQRSEKPILTLPVAN